VLRRRPSGEVDPLAEAESLAGGFPGRLPGSDSERRAARHLQGRLAELGREAEIEPIDAWPSLPLACAIHALLGIVGSVLSVSLPVVGASFVLAAVVLTLLDVSGIPITRRLLGRRASQNVVSWGDRAAPGALVIVAHCDVGRGGLVLAERWQERRAALGRLMRRPIGLVEPFLWALVGLLVCCLLRLPGVDGTVLTAIQFVFTVALIVAVPLLLDIAMSPPEPRENDNASGVALALALAGGATNRLEHFGVHIVLTGSQKAVGQGMHAFLRRHRAELGRTRTVILNIDEVGAGTVRWTRREGPLVTLRSHVQLTRLCEDLAEDDEDAQARPLVNRAPSDGYAARAAGLPAITITCRNQLDRAPEGLDPEALRRAEGFCAELIARIDAEVGPDLPPRPAPVSERDDRPGPAR
jgi:Peptidase family M28